MGIDLIFGCREPEARSINQKQTKDLIKSN